MMNFCNQCSWDTQLLQLSTSQMCQILYVNNFAWDKNIVKTKIMHKILNMLKINYNKLFQL